MVKPKYRFCVDFRALNAVTQFDTYPPSTLHRSIFLSLIVTLCFGRLIFCKWVCKIFMGSVLVQELFSWWNVKVCQHFGLSYAVRTPLQAYSTWKLANVATSSVGQGSVYGEGIKDLAVYSRSCRLLWFLKEQHV